MPLRAFCGNSVGTSYLQTIFWECAAKFSKVSQFVSAMLCSVTVSDRQRVCQTVNIICLPQYQSTIPSEGWCKGLFKQLMGNNPLKSCPLQCLRACVVCARACKWGCVYLHRPRRSLPRLSYRFDGLISLLLPLPTTLHPSHSPSSSNPPPPPPVSSFSLFFRKSERRWVEQSERIHGHCVSITVCVMVSPLSGD